tara:strand:+ start:43 stop:1035 length:993 start_codon:yes stop_codon:yes gene_type:complete
MKHLDLFSGAGGFSLGLKQAGFSIKKTYFSEIDKHAIANYKQNFKDAEYIGSVSNVRGGDLPKIDIITFGSPCQDFSLAGKRKGMDGDRSSLILEAIRLIQECRPRFFIWENVKGAFSSNSGEDFAAILQAFTNIGGYRLEWQLLNTKRFLPQNRERIYLVGYIGEKRRGKIFPIPEDNKSINELQKQQANTCTLTTRYGANGNGSYIAQREFNAQKQVIGAMRGRNPLNSSDRTTGSPTVQRLEINKNNVTNTLTSVQKDNLVVTDRIRRLTPIECERLQGFPDNWTSSGNYDGEIKLTPESQRYKLMGNAVTVNVVEAIGKQLKINKL